MTVDSSKTTLFSGALTKFLAAMITAICIAWTQIANAAPLTDVSGSWNITGNQSAGVLKISQLVSPSACKPIEGTIYGDSKAVGYYCPSTGKLAFTRQVNDRTAAAQMWVGNVSDVGQPNRMGGTFHAVNTGAGSGVLGEYGFQGTK